MQMSPLKISAVFNQQALTADNSRFYRTLRSRAACAGVLQRRKSKPTPVNFITTVQSRAARYLSLSQTHVCGEEEELLGEEDLRPPFSRLPSKSPQKKKKTQAGVRVQQLRISKQPKKNRSETSLQQHERPGEYRRASTEPSPRAQRLTENLLPLIDGEI